MAERKRAAEEIGLMIEEEVVEFKEWIATLGVVPVISALREKALRIQTETMASIENKMPNLTEREKKILNKHTKSIINQMLKDPILASERVGIGWTGCGENWLYSSKYSDWLKMNSKRKSFVRKLNPLEFQN